MANIKSQKKRIRTNERARLRNQAIKSALRTDIRSFREAAEAGDKDKATEALRAASRSLDAGYPRIHGQDTPSCCHRDGVTARTT